MGFLIKLERFVQKINAKNNDRELRTRENQTEINLFKFVISLVQRSPLN